jgi:hypothetical protein
VLLIFAGVTAFGCLEAIARRFGKAPAAAA